MLYTDTTRGYDYHSYTFPVVNTPIGAGLENILISLQPDGTYKDYLIHYEVSEEEIEMIYNEDFVDLEGKVNYLLLENGTFSQNTFEKIYFDNDCWYESSWISGNPCTVDGHLYGDPDCELIGTSSEATAGYTHTSLITCNNPGGGDGGDITGGDPTGGDPNLNDGGSDDSIIIVDCISSDIICDEIEDCNPTLTAPLSNLVLTDDEICWVNHSDQTIIKLRLENYLTDGGDSDFAQLAFEALDKDGIDDGQVDFENELILDESFVNDVKLKCVYDKLKASNSNLFKATIGNFISDPKLNMRIIKGNCENTDDACCDDSNIATTGVVNLIIEDTTGSVLDTAALILHEAIHAEISRYVLLQAPTEDVNDRPRILQLYKYYKALYSEGNIEHIYMTEHYINPIASALRKLDSYSYPIDYYKSYAWDGLRIWDVMNLLSMEENTIYSDYRVIVESNTSLTCD